MFSSEDYWQCWIHCPRTRISHSDVRQGDVVYSPGEEVLIFVKNIHPGSSSVTEISTSSDLFSLRSKSVELKDWQWSFIDKFSYEKLMIKSDLIPAKESASRKDFCHTCQSDVLYWRAMAAFCTHCNKMILGG